MKPLRLALALFLSLALLANGWAATRLHASAAQHVTQAALAAADELPPCHGAHDGTDTVAAAPALDDAPTPAKADTGCCGSQCQHLCGLMLTMLPTATAGALGLAPSTTAGPVPASEPFASHPAAGLWRPPRA